MPTTQTNMNDTQPAQEALEVEQKPSHEEPKAHSNTRFSYLAFPDEQTCFSDLITDMHILSTPLIPSTLRNKPPHLIHSDEPPSGRSITEPSAAALAFLETSARTAHISELDHDLRAIPEIWQNSRAAASKFLHYIAALQDPRKRAVFYAQKIKLAQQQIIAQRAEQFRAQAKARTQTQAKGGNKTAQQESVANTGPPLNALNLRIPNTASVPLRNTYNNLDLSTAALMHSTLPSTRALSQLLNHAIHPSDPIFTTTRRIIRTVPPVSSSDEPQLRREDEANALELTREEKARVLPMEDICIQYPFRIVGREGIKGVMGRAERLRVDEFEVEREMMRERREVVEEKLRKRRREEEGESGGGDQMEGLGKRRRVDRPVVLWGRRWGEGGNVCRDREAGVRWRGYHEDRGFGGV